MRQPGYIFLQIFLMAFALCSPSAANSSLISDLDRLSSESRATQESSMQSISDRIKADPEAASSQIHEALKQDGLSDDALAYYAWALGETRRSEALPALMDLALKHDSQEVQGAAYWAISTIGGREAGEFLLARVRETEDTDKRFAILNYLAQMKYEPALKEMETLLRVDPREQYWMPIFVFATMGDPSVPFLIKMIESDDINTRINALSLIGHWLLPLEAEGPLRERYWKEKDIRIKVGILGSLEAISANTQRIKEFSESVIARDKDQEAVKFARESIENLGRMKDMVKSAKESRKPDAQAFQQQYDMIYNSYGKEGDYIQLANAATMADEPRLKALREHILLRSSDEAFYDYQKVNMIIIVNRLIANGE